MTKKKKAETPIPDDVSALEELRRRAMVCQTHHGACDCKEYTYALLRIAASKALTLWHNCDKGDIRKVNEHDLAMLGQSLKEYFGEQA